MMKARTIFICLLVLLSGTAVSGQQSGDKQTHRLTLPNRNWSLDVSLEGFTVVNEEIKAVESVYGFYAGQFPSKPEPLRIVNFAIYMEPARLKGTAADLRDFTMKKMKKNDAVDKSSLNTFEYGQIPILRATIDLAGIGIQTLNGVVSQNKGLKAFFVKDDAWITVSLGASPFKKDDERLFYSILDSVKFIDNSAPSSSFDYYQKGRALFLQGEYRAAIEPLSRALELEQQKSQLARSEWRALILELANAYGAIGNKSAFEEVLGYGMTRDPNYYRFHFMKAHVYASEGNLDEAIASLEKAFLYQQREPQAIQLVQPLPHPMFDPGFERFRKDDKFRKAVKAMKKAAGQ